MAHHGFSWLPGISRAAWVRGEWGQHCDWCSSSAGCSMKLRAAPAGTAHRSVLTCSMHQPCCLGGACGSTVTGLIIISGLQHEHHSSEAAPFGILHPWTEHLDWRGCCRGRLFFFCGRGILALFNGRRCRCLLRVQSCRALELRTCARGGRGGAPTGALTGSTTGIVHRTSWLHSWPYQGSPYINQHA